MKLKQILFSRRGQIGGSDYWVGCAVLLLAGIILHLLAFGFIYAVDPNMIGVVADVTEKMGLGHFGFMIPTILLISLLIYPYFCLYTKRLRDIGVSAWWHLVIFLVYYIGISALASAIYGLITILEISLYEVFMTSPLPGASEEEVVAGIIAGTRRTLIAGAIFNATLHAVIAIIIDIILGKLKPKTSKDSIVNQTMACA